jgi:ribose 5-phosphate isomerase A
LGRKVSRGDGRKEEGMIDADGQKTAAGEAAALLVQDGMTLGLGTGSTAAKFVTAVARRAKAEGLQLTCVSTSEETEALARSLGLVTRALDEVDVIDLTVDGADEIGPGLSLIKGGGAALLREKLVWEASRRCVAIADGSKSVAVLGAFPLPVEVIAFGHAQTAKRLEAALTEFGIAVSPKLRLKDGIVVRTDSGQVLYDLACQAIPDPKALATVIKSVTGVVEHGLFLGLAAQAIIARDDGSVVTRNS